MAGIVDREIRYRYVAKWQKRAFINKTSDRKVIDDRPSIYCKSGNIRGTLIFANFAEIQQARIQKRAFIDKTSDRKVIDDSCA